MTLYPTPLGSVIVCQLADIHLERVGWTIATENISEPYAPRDRGVSRLDADQAIPGDQLLGLGERSVHPQVLAASGGEPHGRRARQQTLGHEQHPGFRHLT